MRSTKGFTLIEILIVVIILGILAAIVIPQFQSPANAKAGTFNSAQYPLNQIDADAVVRDGLATADADVQENTVRNTAAKTSALQQTASIDNPSDEIESRPARSDDSK
jgi:prepilin-type N-terminal cleavage/methylation domain-containing protein